MALLAYIDMTADHVACCRRCVRVDPRAVGGRDLPRFRAAVPALDRTGVQGRSRLRRVPADHLRRRRGPPGARARVHVRRREGGAGARRLRRARRPWPTCAARASRAQTWRPACRRCERPWRARTSEHADDGRRAAPGDHAGRSGGVRRVRRLWRSDAAQARAGARATCGASGALPATFAFIAVDPAGRRSSGSLADRGPRRP